MKRFAERDPKKRGALHRGYLATCSNCGLVVVHAKSTMEPMHMHARSRKCRELGNARRTRERGAT